MEKGWEPRDVRPELPAQCGDCPGALLPTADSGHPQPCRCGPMAPIVPEGRVQIQDRETGLGKMELPSGSVTAAFPKQVSHPQEDQKILFVPHQEAPEKLNQSSALQTERCRRGQSRPLGAQHPGQGGTITPAPPRALQSLGGTEQPGREVPIAGTGSCCPARGCSRVLVRLTRLCPACSDLSRSRASRVPGAGTEAMAVPGREPGAGTVRERGWGRGSSGEVPKDARRSWGCCGHAKGRRGDVGGMPGMLERC